jgi:hypothetical protein
VPAELIIRASCGAPARPAGNPRRRSCPAGLVVFAIESHPFAARDFIGGDAALDFVNTVTGRDKQPRDWLDGYARLLEWAALVRLLPEKNLRR